MTTKSLLILGSTGSIGTQTLDIVRNSGGSFEVAALSAARSWQRVLEQVREFHPKLVAMADPEAGERLRPHLPALVGQLPKRLLPSSALLGELPALSHRLGHQPPDGAANLLVQRVCTAVSPSRSWRIIAAR